MSERVLRVRKIQATRLGGAGRITIDDPGTPPYKRYAHIMKSKNCGSTNLYTSDSAAVIDPAYRYDDWRLIGVIDLNTGETVDSDA